MFFFFLNDFLVKKTSNFNQEVFKVVFDVNLCRKWLLKTYFLDGEGFLGIHGAPWK